MTNVVLISIHPEHVANILSGNKVFEYRKTIPKKKVSHLVLYCTDPVKKIIAIVEVLGCITGSPSQVWSQTSFGGGISRHFFRQYFSGQKLANAYLLGRAYQVEEPMDLSCLPGRRTPPQSFYYLDESAVRAVAKRLSVEPSVRPRILFVGGIHGVGKTTLCGKCFGPLGFKCVTASALIAADRVRECENKCVENVGDNQVALLRQLEFEKAQCPRLVLDGHFSLINKNEEIEPIGVDVFRLINPDMLILIKGSPEKICNRLKGRDNKEWSLSFLKQFQTIEEQHAIHVAESIGVPLKIFNDGDGGSVVARSVDRYFSKNK